MHQPRPLYPGILLAIAVGIAGCGSEHFDDDCSHQMDDLRDELGPPEEVRRLDSEGIHSETWSYPSLGFSRTFAWEDGIADSCRTTDFRVAPVGQAARGG
jgi:hypothetical protein